MIGTNLFICGFRPHIYFSLEDSFIYALANAWGSKAVFGKICASACLGTPVRGLLTPADSKHDSAQHSSWAPTSFFEWRTASPRSFFDQGIVLDHDAIYHLSSLGEKCLDASCSAFPKLLIQPDRLKLVAAKSPRLSPGDPPSSEGGTKASAQSSGST